MYAPGNPLHSSETIRYLILQRLLTTNSVAHLVDGSPGHILHHQGTVLAICGINAEHPMQHLPPSPLSHLDHHFVPSQARKPHILTILPLPTESCILTRIAPCLQNSPKSSRRPALPSPRRHLRRQRRKARPQGSGRSKRSRTRSAGVAFPTREPQVAPPCRPPSPLTEHGRHDACNFRFLFVYDDSFEVMTLHDLLHTYLAQRNLGCKIARLPFLNYTESQEKARHISSLA